MDGATTPHAAAPAGTSRTTSARLLRPFPSATPIHPPLRPSSPYSEGPRSEAEQKRRSRRTARTGIGDAQRARPWSRPRRHRPGRARRCPSPTPPGPRRPRPVRPGPRWCEPGLGAGGLGVARGRRAPSPACAMRAQRDGIRPRSIRASSPRTMRAQVTSPNRLPPRLSPEDACGTPGRRRSRPRRAWLTTAARNARETPEPAAGPPPPGCRPLPDGPVPRQAGPSGVGLTQVGGGAPSPASGGALRGGPLPVCSASPGPRQAEPSRRRTTPTVLSRIARSMTGVQFST